MMTFHDDGKLSLTQLSTARAVRPKSRSPRDFPRGRARVSQWKMALSLGWVPSKADRESTYEHLNAVLPAQLKFDLHVLMVRPTQPSTTGGTHKG